MISFIVIGRNEGLKLTRCFESIFKTIHENHLNNYEVIYVDSNSTDSSIDNAKNYNVNKIFKITGKCNAAIGRNVGATESKGDILCFIDGDVEIIPEFFPIIFSEKKELIYPFVSGKIVQFYYDTEGALISKDTLLPSLEDRFENLTEGPFFLIARKDWFSVGGMRNNFKTGEDHDLGLRLRKNKRLSILRKKEVAAIHYTIDYHNKGRMWRDLLNGNQVYHRSLLYRKHILNPFVYKKIISSDYTLLILCLVTIFTILLPNLFLFGFYFILIFFKSVIIAKRKFNFILSQYFYFVARDLMNLFGFFLFYPKEVKKIEYDSIL
jgi:glycosyltransferase involved in cell wall biosynthesis